MINSFGIDKIVEEARAAWRMPGAAVAIICEDEIYVKGYGVKELNGHDCVTPDTLFAIGSTTKAFTTTAMAILVDEGKMKWDDPVRKYLPYFKLSDPLADANVTLRDLVCHRTGLARHDALWYGSDWNSEEIMQRIGLLPLDYPFRSCYHYNNLMYMVAGQAVGAAWGGTWENFIKARILDPLGMTGVIFSTHTLKRIHDYCTGHSYDEDNVKTTSWLNIDMVAPAGAMIAGVRDLSRWVKFQLGDGTWEGKLLVSKASLEETHTPQVAMRVNGKIAELSDMALSSYCLGWNLQQYRSHTIITHAGAIDGFNANITLVPKLNLGIAALGNLDGGAPVSALSKNLLDFLLKLPPIDWNAELMADLKEAKERRKSEQKEREKKQAKNTKPSRSLESYTGDYEDAAYGDMQIALQDGALCLKWHSHTAKLHHFHYDTFAGKLENPDSPARVQVLFALDPDGDVASARLLWPEVNVDKEFKKVRKEESED